MPLYTHTITHSHTLTHSLSLVLVVMIKSEEHKTKISHARSLILTLFQVPPWRNLLPKSISDYLPGLAEEAWALKLLQSIFAELDKDGNGTLEPDEIMGEYL